MAMTTFGFETRSSVSQRLSVKRCMDVFLVLTCLPSLIPLFLVLAAAIKLTSKGPVLFTQTRVGKYGRHFRMIKFRSMHHNAEAHRSAVEDLNERSGPCMKIRRDPRITSVGRILRRWSLDELPQIFNVLFGHMSLVGPRPALVDEVRDYPPEALRRHNVLPGITGLWQVSGRADADFEKMIKLDLEYVGCASLRTDISILFKTVNAVLSGKGAY